MTDQNPITPPPELVAKWASSMCGYYEAARWGADQELEACIDVLGGQWEWDLLSQCTGWKEFRDQSEEILRAARRPKPPSLAKRALHILGTHGDLSCAEHATLARALEQLDD